MAITPVVSGMWGVRPNALRRRVDIAPQLPDEWQRAELRNIRVGSTRFDVVAERHSGDVAPRMSINHREGPVLDVIFEGAT